MFLFWDKKLTMRKGEQQSSFSGLGKGYLNAGGLARWPISAADQWCRALDCPLYFENLLLDA